MLLWLLVVGMTLAGCMSTTPSPTLGPADQTLTPTRLPISETPLPSATASAAPTASPSVPQPSATASPSATSSPSPTSAAATPVGGSQNGMVILAFADAKDGAYTVAFPAMRARGVAGLAYVNVEPIVQGQAGRLTPEQLDELNAAGWDIASHGYTHEDPTAMTAQQLDDNLGDAHRWLLDRGYSRGARHYGPPSNNCNQQVLDAALQYYQTVWCREYSRLPAGYRFGVGACGNNTAWSRLEQAFDNLVGQPDRVLRCTFHDLVPEQPTGNQGDLARMNQILDYLAAKQIRVVTLSDLLDGTVQKQP